MNKPYKVQLIENYALVIEQDADVLNDEWCLEAHEEYECDLPRYKDLNNPKISWFLRRLNMDYLNDKPKGFRFWKKRDGSVWKVIATIDKDMRAEGVPLIILLNQELNATVQGTLKGMEIYTTWDKDENSGIALGGFVRGYEAALEDKKWSDEDMVGLLSFTIDKKGGLSSQEFRDASYERIVELYKESLKNKYPEYVELDTREICPNYNGTHIDKDCSCKSGFIRVLVTNGENLIFRS